jgi:hypothetical protein
VLGRTAVSQTRRVYVTQPDPNNGGGLPPQVSSPGWVVRLDTTIGSTLGRQTGRCDSVLRQNGGVRGTDTVCATVACTGLGGTCQTTPVARCGR